LELKNAKNHAEPSMLAWQMGVKYGKMEKEMEELRQENSKMKEEINKISDENGKLKEQMTEMKGQLTEMNSEMGQLKKENETMKDLITGMDAKFAGKITELKTEFANSNREIIEKQNADKKEVH
jgi:chromosome segregation ATPase